jgi:hypothetical protein
VTVPVVPEGDPAEAAPCEAVEDGVTPAAVVAALDVDGAELAAGGAPRVMAGVAEATALDGGVTTDGGAVAADVAAAVAGVVVVGAFVEEPAVPVPAATDVAGGVPTATVVTGFGRGGGV